MNTKKLRHYSFKDEAQTALFKDSFRTALQTLFISVIKDEAQTALFKDPVRTAL